MKRYFSLFAIIYMLLVFHSYLKADKLYIWGANDFGKLGDGTTNDKHSPAMLGTDTTWLQADGTQDHTVAVKRDGTLWAWGHNYYGELGDGTQIDRHTPVQIGNETNWKQVKNVYWHSAAIKKDGTLWVWGKNTNGEIGDGSTTERHSPVQIGSDNNWVQVDCGGGQTFALKSDGTLWAWGNNTFGQLGNGTTIESHTPVQVGSDNNWSKFSSGYDNTLAIKTDGTLWAWGWNYYGQLGDGTTDTKFRPVQIGTGTNWSQVSCFRHNARAIKTDGTLWAWGDNEWGQLGDGTTIDRHSPFQIGTETNWTQVVCGFYHTLAIKSDGTLWAWGFNGHGELGDGTTNNNYYPGQIGNETTWTNLAAGAYHSMAFNNFSCNILTSSQKDVDFGNRTCLSDSTIKVIINNMMKTPVEVTNTIFAKGVNSKLTVTNGGTFTIASNDSRQLSINIKPTSSGIINDTLLIIYPTGCDTLKIPVKGIRDIIGIELSVSDTLFWGRACPNIILDTIIKAKNISSRATKFFINNIVSPFSIIGTDPFVTLFNLNETKNLHIRFISANTGIFYQDIIITDTCSNIKKIVIKVEIFAPQVDAGQDQTICLGDTIIIGSPANSGTPPYIYKWTPVSGLSDANSAPTKASPDASTMYYLSVTDKTGCTTLDSIMINVNPSLIISLEDNIFLCIDSTYTFDPQISSGTMPLSKIQWTPATGLSNPNKINPKVSFTTSGIYKYILTVTDANGCIGIDSINITVHSLPNLVLNKAMLDFGTLDPCLSSKDDSVEITNAGTENIIVDEYSFKSGFSIVSPPIPFLLKPGEKRTIVLRYIAANTGQVTDDILISGSPCKWIKSIQCKANKNEMYIKTNINGIDFGQSLSCLPVSKDSLFILTNTGSSDITVYFGNITLNLPFTIISPKSVRIIAPNDTIHILIHYEPKIAGDYSEDINIPLEAGSCKDTLKVAVLGKYVNPTMSSTIRNINFPDILGCEPSRDTTITIQNTGTIDVVIVGAEPDSIFTLSAKNATIPAGESIDLKIKFSPKSTGFYSGILIIRYEPCGNADTVMVTGNKQGVMFVVTDSLDFGEIVLCQEKTISKTLPFTIENRSSSGIDGAVKSLIQISTPFNTSLKVGDLILNGKTNTYNLTFDIDSSLPDGDITGTLDFVLSPCDSVKSIKLRVKKTSVNFISTDTLNFRNVNLGSSKIDTIRIKNTGTAFLHVNSIENIVPPFELINTIPDLPTDLKPNEELIARISYTPNYDKNDTLVIKINAEPCGISNDAVLIGQVFNKNYVLKTCNLEGYPGNIIEIPVILENLTNLQETGIKAIKTDLNFNPTLLSPLDYTMIKVNEKSAYIILNNLLLDNAITDTLTKVKCVAGLGNEEGCDLTLSNPETIGGIADISIIDGTFHLLGICYEGGARLLNPNNRVELLKISPNPNDGNLNVELNLLEKGASTLCIYNSNGELMFEHNLAGTTAKIDLNISTTEYANGLYFVSLQTPTIRKVEQLVVFK